MRQLSKVLCLAIPLLYPGYALALSLGEPQIESLIGQTLDIKIPITDVADRSQLRLITHDAQLYSDAKLPYTDLQERLLIELVATTSVPYVAVSSIGSISAGTFSLVIGISAGQARTIQKYNIRLRNPAPVKATRKQLSAAEVLLRLIHSISLETGIGQAEVLGQLQQISAGKQTQPGERQLLIKFAAPQIDQEFIAGLRQLLDAPERQSLNAALKSTKPELAVSQLLFADKKSRVLKNLLRYAKVRSLKDDGNMTQRIAFLKERIAILENQVIQFRQLLADSTAEAPPQAAPPNALVSFLRNPWQAKYLLSRWVWGSVIALALVLLLLLVWWRYRLVTKPAIAPMQQRSELPGQRALEKELGISDAPAAAPSDSKEDEMESKINLAAMYIQMEDYTAAKQELDAVLANGNKAQVQRAKEIKQQIKKGTQGEGL